MKALTIQQPYAHLIVTPQERLPRGQVRKRIENRVWPTTYRGWLAIHAGKGTNYLRSSGWPGTEGMRRTPTAQDFPEMAFVAIVGLARMVDCLWYHEMVQAVRDKLPMGTLSSAEVADLLSHRHAEGPVCWVLQDAFALETPVVTSGAQRLWEVPDEVIRRLAEQINQQRPTEGMTSV